VPVKLEQVEGEKERLSGGATPDRRAQPVEVRDAALVVAHHTLAVDRGGRRRHRAQRFDDQRHAVAPIATVPAEYAHSLAVAAADETEPVVLDFIGPLRTYPVGTVRTYFAMA